MNQPKHAQTTSPTHFQEEFPLDYTITAVPVLPLTERYINSPPHISHSAKRAIYKCYNCNSVISTSPESTSPEQALSIWIAGHSDCPINPPIESYNIIQDPAYKGMILNGTLRT